MSEDQAIWVWYKRIHDERTGNVQRKSHLFNKELPELFKTFPMESFYVHHYTPHTVIVRFSSYDIANYFLLMFGEDFTKEMSPFLYGKLEYAYRNSEYKKDVEDGKISTKAWTHYVNARLT